ncbi:2Fe-2S iron-sulfur cluster-binding protein [Aquabacter sp. CN5-332]|uniref:2Fe-2S iron-sulfur cluster-binding protein n=1 Tax=Aquabacter sp. CN5-332 TaxID=3156608 RepID=UPI0032B4B430
MSVTAKLIVRRGNAGEAAFTSEYEVPYTPGQSVLDGLRYVRAHMDETLSVRHSCINANTCKECMIIVDGKVEYACTARLEPRDMVLEPLSNKAHLRDLVTEIGPPDERLEHALKVQAAAKTQAAG